MGQSHKTTHLGDAQWLYEQIAHWRTDMNLRLIHHSYSTVTGAGASTKPRLKYVELWFSTRLSNTWELRTSGLDTACGDGCSVAQIDEPRK